MNTEENVVEILNGNKINILNSVYTIEFREEKDDEKLEDLSGYIDFTSKKIIINRIKRDNRTVDNLDYYYKQVIKHEIIHGYLIESGLNNECNWHCEEMVDWVALQFNKLKETFEQNDLL
jgi:hypothetical protein